MDSNFHIKTTTGHMIVRLILALATIPCFFSFISAQQNCVSADRIAALLADVNQGKNQTSDPALKAEILEMKKGLLNETARQVLADRNRSSENKKRSNKDVPQATSNGAKPEERICQILNSKQWPGKSSVDNEGASSWITLIKTYASVQQQRAVLPIISAGVERGEIPKDDELAALIDKLRLRLGLPQIFGTQFIEENGFLVLYPIQSDQNIDAWRSEYGLPTLREGFQRMQIFYRKLVIRSTAKVKRVPVSVSANSTTGAAPLSAETEGDVVKVDTSLVVIDATISGTSIPKIDKADFRILEDGKEQEIAEFKASDAPFDIVLLLDLSGSTSDKVGLIKKTTKRFVEMKRDADRVAIVTFNSTQTIVSPLESSKEKLVDSLSGIKGIGASNVWDSEKFAMDLLRRDSPPNRRKAIVVMTDGVDNGLFYSTELGSSVLFGDLLEDVRNSQIAIFPIYLDPRGAGGGVARLMEDAQRTMQILADDSGGTFYTTSNLDNLSEVYERVLQDVGRVFSISYQPKNDARDGTWRTIKVEVVGHPELKVRARSGYYAK